MQALLFAVGVITGTVLSFEMGLLWPNFTGTFGGVFGLGFAIEGFSFFLEAIFIGIYVYGWGRFSPRTHLASGIPIVLAGMIGSLMVIAVNAWMNHPGGFRLRGGEVVDVDPWQALFGNSYLWHELIHMYVAGYIGRQVEYGIRIPHLLSLLSTHSWNGTVEGLATVRADERPPVNIVRIAFQTMVGIGTLLALLGVVYVATWIWRRRLPESTWFYRALALAAPLSVVALIAGWVVTEVGRQPWVVYRVMRTSDAVTGADGVPVGFAVLGATYAVVAIGLTWVLLRLARAPLELEPEPRPRLEPV